MNNASKIENILEDNGLYLQKGHAEEIAQQILDAMDGWEDIAKTLWQLLDDIDTLDDACKSNDEAFRKLTYKTQQKRHKYLVSDGYNLTLPSPPKEQT